MFHNLFFFLLLLYTYTWNINSVDYIVICSHHSHAHFFFSRFFGFSFLVFSVLFSVRLSSVFPFQCSFHIQYSKWWWSELFLSVPIAPFVHSFIHFESVLHSIEFLWVITINFCLYCFVCVSRCDFCVVCRSLLSLHWFYL